MRPPRFTTHTSTPNQDINITQGLSNMSGTPSSSSSSVPEPLPGFLSTQQIKDLPSPHLKAGTRFVNIVGFVADFRAPFKTKGTDFKCEFQIKDHSSPDGLKVNIFGKEELMPEISNEPGDAVLIRNARVSSKHLCCYDA